MSLRRISQAALLEHFARYPRPRRNTQTVIMVKFPDLDNRFIKLRNPVNSISLPDGPLSS